jgi:hypothetical protein
MRRTLSAALLVVSSLGLLALPAGADSSSDNPVQLAFDLGDNADVASASSGVFNVIVDVLPEHTPGVVRVVAIAPSDANVSNLVCRYQTVSRSKVECGFNFTASGTWRIRAQYAPSRSESVQAATATNIYVGE